MAIQRLMRFSAPCRVAFILSHLSSSHVCMSAGSRTASAARSSSTSRSPSRLARSSSIASVFFPSRCVCGELLCHVAASVPSTTFLPSLPRELSASAVLPAAAALLPLTVHRCTPCAVPQLLLGTWPPVLLLRPGVLILRETNNPTRHVPPCSSLVTQRII